MQREGFLGMRESREDSMAPSVLAKEFVKRPGLHVAFKESATT